MRKCECGNAEMHCRITFHNQKFMKIKKVIGYLFLVIAGVLILAIFGQLGAFAGAILGFFKIFSGSLNADEAGSVTGHFIYWVLYVALTIVLFIYGKKWISKSNISSPLD
jgi:hypothetical protein